MTSAARTENRNKVTESCNPTGLADKPGDSGHRPDASYESNIAEYRRRMAAHLKAHLLGRNVNHKTAL